ncbi:MAG: class IV adenylate cyclase [Candidatus Bathyarchaeota archaeon]
MNIRLIELKAALPSLAPVREIINSMGARREGEYKQVDTYFEVNVGRLKLREVEGELAKFVYYEREDIPNPKVSNVVIFETSNSVKLKTIMKRAVGVKVIVTKQREIYRFQGTQIHLDQVEDLGTFIEFEREVTNITEDRKILKKLMERLKINPKDLIEGSYSDLVTERVGEF